MPSSHTNPPRAEKVAISLPPELLARVEQWRARTGESRSAVVRRALELLLRRLDHFEAVREYVEAYEVHPETEEDERLGAPTPEELSRDEWDESA